MLLMEKDGKRYLVANHTLKYQTEKGFKLVKYIDIPKVRAHHLAKGILVDDYIKEQQDLIDTFTDKAIAHKKIKDKLKELLK